MDSAQFDYLIKLVIAVIGSYTLVLGSIAGIVVAFVKRSNGHRATGNRTSWDGSERRGDGYHSAPCSSVANLSIGIEQVRADIAQVRTGIEALRENLGGRIDDLYKRSMV